MPYFNSIGEPAGYEEDYSLGMGAVMPPEMMGGPPMMPPEMGGGMGPLQAGDFPGGPEMGGGMPPEMMGGPPMGGPPMGGPPMGGPPGMAPFGPDTNDAKEVLRQRAEKRLAASKRFQGAANEINGIGI